MDIYALSLVAYKMFVLPRTYPFQTFQTR